MIVPFLMLVAMIGLVPFIGITDVNLTIGILSAALAAALLAILIWLPRTSLVRLSRLLHPAFVVALSAPALWMIMQLLPERSLANPMWASASAALNQSLASRVTIDVGATLLSLAQYCVVAAAALVTLSVVLDRWRAAIMLLILVLITTVVAGREMIVQSGSPLHDSSDFSAQASVLTVIGTLLSCAKALELISQLRRPSRLRSSKLKAILILSGAITSFLICITAMLISDDPVVLVATMFGVGIVFAIYAIRQWVLGPWGKAALAAATAIGFLAAFTVVPVKNKDITIALATQSQPATERMLLSTAPAGWGAGTFSALLPIYRDFSAAASLERPTAAAAITIEMGRTFLYILIVITLFGAWILFDRSLARGHDYIYSAAGSGALISLLIVAFVNDGILHFSASLFVAVLFGLAFAQSLRGTEPDGHSSPLDTQMEMASGPDSISRIWFTRVALALFGLALVSLAAWVLAAQRHSQDKFTDQNADLIGTSRDELGRAASIAMVRGDLWAESGFAYVPPSDSAAAIDYSSIPEQALNDFSLAIHYAPHRGDVWLMLAAFASRQKPAGSDVGTLLKMSYYTAPNELRLVPLRLFIALAVALNDPELRELVKRDIGLMKTIRSTTPLR